MLERLPESDSFGSRPVFLELARRKECEIIEGHLMVDPVPRVSSIPPKYSVAQVLGYLKGKSAIHIARG